MTAVHSFLHCSLYITGTSHLKIVYTVLPWSEQNCFALFTVSVGNLNKAYTITKDKWQMGSVFFFSWRHNPFWVCILQPSSGAIASSRTKFRDHTQRRATFGRTPLDEWSVRRRDLWQHTTLTTDKHPCPGGIRTHDLSRRAATDLCLRLRGHWDRQMGNVSQGNCLPGDSVLCSRLKFV